MIIIDYVTWTMDMKMKMKKNVLVSIDSFWPPLHEDPHVRLTLTSITDPADHFEDTARVSDKMRPQLNSTPCKIVSLNSFTAQTSTEV